MCAGHFGSGWIWLCAEEEGATIVQTHDGASVVSPELTPLLVLGEGLGFRV